MYHVGAAAWRCMSSNGFVRPGRAKLCRAPWPPRSPLFLDRSSCALCYVPARASLYWWFRLPCFFISLFSYLNKHQSCPFQGVHRMHARVSLQTVIHVAASSPPIHGEQVSVWDFFIEIYPDGRNIHEEEEEENGGTVEAAQ